MTNQTPSFEKRIKQIVLKHLDDDNFGINKLCKLLFLSRMQVHRKIKKATNLSTSIFIRHVRLEKSAQLLLETNMPVAQIAFTVGFHDPAYFSRCFKKRYGIPPEAYRRGKNDHFLGISA